jgi:transcriptional regulator with XRE-family HTH domain
MSFSAAREKAGMTQNEVAKALGVNQSAVSFWESGRNQPRGKQMVKLAKLYGVTVDELLREEDQNAES